MTRYELLLRLEHNCPYTRFSKAMPKVVTLHWCNNDKDVLEISTPDETTKSDSDFFDKQIALLVHDLKAKVTRKVPISENKEIIVYKHRFSSMKENVNATIEKYNCVEIQPTTYREGSEWYRIMAFNEADVHALYQNLSAFATLRTISQDVNDDSSIKNSIMIPSSSLLGKLTKKQKDALASAVGMGYFDIPSRTSTASIAEQYSISRGTFEEHLRKAEGKILKSLLPYLEMR